MSEERPHERLTDPHLLEEEREIDQSIRPRRLADFVGQARLKDALAVFIAATRERGEPLDHVLFYGPPGLGKTTLAHIIARELGVNITCTSGPVVERPGDLAGLLTNLAEGDVLFIDEIHRLPHVVEEYLYPAMEDFQLDIMIERGPSARSIKLGLKHFTLVGATTRAGLITSPLRARFGLTHRLDFYEPEDLHQIVLRSAGLLGVEVDEGGAREIARRARGTPRIAIRLLRRTRDFAQVRADGRIDRETADRALQLLEVDEQGLDEMDTRILTTIIEKFQGGPVGLNTLAMAVGEEGETLEEIYEPYLVKEGYLNRTPRGREVTPRALAHFGRTAGARRRDQMPLL